MLQLDTDAVTIKYGEDTIEINLDGLVTLEDYMTIIATIKPQDTLVANIEPVNTEDYINYDFLTSSEKGLCNFSLALVAYLEEAVEKISPLKQLLLQEIAKSIGSPTNAMPPIDPAEFEVVNKLGQLLDLSRTISKLGVSSRVGFDNYYVYNKDGSLYALRDLRKIFK